MREDTLVDSVVSFTEGSQDMIRQQFNLTEVLVVDD